jgi:hypothetical protein
MRDEVNTLTLAMGYVRGRVCYTSHPLNQSFSECCPDLPELTSMIKCQIEYICSLHGDPGACHQHATTETDLVGFISNAASASYQYSYSNGSSSRLLSQRPVKYWGSNLLAASDSNSDLALKIRELRYAAQKGL